MNNLTVQKVHRPHGVKCSKLTEVGTAAARTPIATMLEQTKWKIFFHIGTGYSLEITSAATYR